jgi:Ca2+-transporting ATPase
MAFVVLAASQLFYSLSMRSADKSIFKIGLFSNRFLILAILAGIVLQLVVITIPFLAEAFGVHNLSLHDWDVVLILALMPLLINEIIKLFSRSSRKKKI